MPENIPSEKILFVDDEPNVLSGIRRQLHKHFHVTTAQGPMVALETIQKSKTTFAVIVADMRMPELNGVELLEKIAKLSPNSVRIMLTGNADQQTAIDAINRGNIFRFLNKPCAPDQLTNALNHGIKQYQLVTAERELMEKTLRGSIRILTEILSIVDPEEFGRTEKIRQKIKAMTPKLDLAKPWELEMAAMLGPLGMVTIPRELIIKQANDAPLLANEREVLESGPAVAKRLLQNIPRMNDVSEMVLYQNKNFDGSGYPKDELKADAIPLGARVLHALTDLVKYEEQNMPVNDIITSMRRQEGLYDPHILDLALGTLTEAKETVRKTVKIYELHVGMILAVDVCMKNGALLIRSGQIVSNTIKERLNNYYFSNRINEYVDVIALVDDEDQAAAA